MLHVGHADTARAAGYTWHTHAHLEHRGLVWAVEVIEGSILSIHIFSVSVPESFGRGRMGHAFNYQNCHLA